METSIVARRCRDSPGPVATVHSVRLRAVVPFLVGSFALTACGGTSGGTGFDPATRACPVFRELEDLAASVEDADVSDPDAFEQSMSNAVDEFSSLIDELREVLPDELVDDLDAYEAAVIQYDFDEARAARAPLDQYVEVACVTPTTVTTPGAVTG